MIALVHIVLCCIFMLTPKSAIPSGVVGLTYTRLMLIGPFFHESKITTSPHLYVRYYKNNQWSSSKDVATENRLYFHSHPLRYDRIRLNDFERYISHQVGLLSSADDFESVKGLRVFRELNQFVLQEYIKQPIDSLSLVYGVNRYFPATGTTRFDTTFAFTFDPAEIGMAKQLY